MLWWQKHICPPKYNNQLNLFCTQTHKHNILSPATNSPYNVCSKYTHTHTHTRVKHIPLNFLACRQHQKTRFMAAIWNVHFYSPSLLLHFHLLPSHPQPLSSSFRNPVNWIFSDPVASKWFCFISFNSCYMSKIFDMRKVAWNIFLM